MPAHFPKDAHGLARFDGTCLYEHPDPRRSENYEWGTLAFNTERPEVAADSYLQAGPMIRDVALVLDWCAHEVTPSQRERWHRYASQAVWNIWNPEQAHWNGTPQPWSGWGTDDPANNYHYSFIEATMYWALAADDAAWLQLLEDEKWPAVAATVGA